VREEPGDVSDTRRAQALAGTLTGLAGRVAGR
jgi:hypothetical protein